MNWDSIQQFLRIGLQFGGGLIFGQEIADGELYQAAIGGAMSVGAFLWWLLWERMRQEAA